MKTQTDRIECAQCRQMVKAKTARKPAPIPMHETPIYAQLKAEREGRGRYSVGGWIKHQSPVRPQDVEPHLKYPETAATPKSRALLKKGRRK